MALHDDAEHDGLIDESPPRSRSGRGRRFAAAAATTVVLLLLLAATVMPLRAAWTPHGAAARGSEPGVRHGAARFSGPSGLVSKQEEDGDAEADAEADADNTESTIEQVAAIPQTVYVLDCPASDDDTTSMTLVRTMGGLIAAFKLNGKSIILEEPSPESGMQGSTFWPSPQSLFDWPPPPTISGGTEADGETGRSAEGGGTYDVQVDDAKLSVVLTSQPDPDLGVRVVKNVSCDTERQAMVVRYTMEKVDTATNLSLAGWEKTNLPAGALIFWDHGDAETVTRIDDMSNKTSQTLDVDGDTFYFDHSNDDVHEGGTKIASNTTSSWIAAVRDDIMFVKVFKSVPLDKVAPGEGDVAVFARPSFSSIENQGAYGAVKKGKPSVYVVCWYARKLPDGAQAAKGDETMLDAVREVAKLGCPEK